MPAFSPQHFASVGRRLQVRQEVVDAALRVAARILAGHKDRAVVFTLAHLAALTGVPYLRLRGWVSRRASPPYREWFLAKGVDRRRTTRSPRRRMRRIATPSPNLMAQQRWILHRILHTATRHQASVAFHRNTDVVEAAWTHCGCRWLIKLDVENFFESIYEPKIFRVFADLGYPRLLAFELTRLCTRIVPTSNERREGGPIVPRRRSSEAEAYPFRFLPLGSLPQGAPTSPLLANLAVRALDEEIQAIAREHGLVYTRYADDIALSTVRPDFEREEASAVIGKVLRALEREDLRPHRAKTRVIPPGARKIVLGLMVDGTRPRLTREYRNKLRLHAHMLGTLGIPPSEHARRLGFRSVLSMRRHIEGQIAHAKRVEEVFAADVTAKLSGVNWTL